MFVHLCDSVTWRLVTGEPLPATPVSARTYAEHGLPWFDVYDEGWVGVDAAPPLAAVKSVKQIMDAAASRPAPPQDDDDDQPVPVDHVTVLPPPPCANNTVVFDGVW